MGLAEQLGHALSPRRLTHQQLRPFLGRDCPPHEVGAVGRMVGVPAATLRNWEERYKLIRPERSGGGHRLYTRTQVEHIRFLAAHVDSGVHAAEAHLLLAGRLANGTDLAVDEPGEVTLLVLVAERDPYAAEFTEFFLRTEGYQVALVFDAREAEQAIEEQAPHLVVVEWLLGGGAGRALCRRVKERGLAPCLAVSSLDARDEALALGADAFLRKPLEPLRFVSTVKDLLGRSAYLAVPTTVA
jgi:CheY-like chemotaxis protein